MLVVCCSKQWAECGQLAHTAVPTALLHDGYGCWVHGFTRLQPLPSTPPTPNATHPLCCIAIAVNREHIITRCSVAHQPNVGPLSVIILLRPLFFLLLTSGSWHCLVSTLDSHVHIRNRLDARSNHRTSAHPER